MAEKNGHGWELTFPEWKGVWDASGKWLERGKKPGQFEMVRLDKSKPFCLANIAIRQIVGKAPLLTKTEKFVRKTECNPADFESPEQMRIARQRFVEQRGRARQRGIGWELTFEEWWGIWRSSGQWAARGRDHAQAAVMARRGDVGPYSKENVYITTLVANFDECRGKAQQKRRQGQSSLQC